MRSFFGSSAFFRFRQEVLCRCRNLHLQSFSWSGDKLVHSKVFTKAGEDGVRTEAADLHYYYDAEDRPALLTYNGTRFMYQYNLQGDIIGMIAGHHTKVLRYEYDAWGKQLSCTGSRKDDMGVQNPFRYRHYQYDDETGLYYLNSRYYSPELGRFISADTVLGRPGKLNGHNLYSYCRSNPLNSYDPSGYDEETFNDLNNIINLSDEYIKFLETVYFYSLSMQDKSELNTSTPEVYTTAKVLSNCEAFAEKKYSYERYDCAYSIAMQLPRRTTHTGITTIMANDAIASVSLEAAGGFANLLEGMMLIVYDSSYTKPGRHGGIYVNQSTVYESSPGLKGFRKSTPARQKWNKVVWLDGMILSPKQMEIVGMIVFMVRE